MQNLKFLFLFLLFIFLINKNSHADTLESLSKELSEIRDEISKLSSPQINKPIASILDPSGRPVTAIILDTDDANNLVTYIELGKQEGAKTGALLSKENVKDLVTYQNAQAKAQFTFEQMQIQAQ